MELRQIIKWCDNTNYSLFSDHPETAREYDENNGYIPEYEAYTYAVAEHFLKMEQSNKIALAKRLFRNVSSLTSVLSQHKKDFINESPADPSSYWLECFAGEIYSDIPFFINEWDALFFDSLKFNCEVIRLCTESNIDPSECTPSVSVEIINDLAMFLKQGDAEITAEGSADRISHIDRIGAMCLLLKRAGVTPNTIDKTKIAYFIQVITDGTPPKKPKNSYVYRNFKPDGNNGGRELLRSIGIE